MLIAGFELWISGVISGHSVIELKPLLKEQLVFSYDRKLLALRSYIRTLERVVFANNVILKAKIGKVWSFFRLTVNYFDTFGNADEAAVSLAQKMYFLATFKMACTIDCVIAQCKLGSFFRKRKTKANFFMGIIIRDSNWQQHMIKSLSKTVLNLFRVFGLKWSCMSCYRTVIMSRYRKGKFAVSFN